MINVKHFGAIGDGIFDINNPFKDTLGIQKAINIASGLDKQAPGRAGEEIYIPPGEYFIGDLIIVKPVIIRGETTLAPEDQKFEGGYPTHASILHVPSYFPYQNTKFASRKNGMLITTFSIKDAVKKDDQGNYIVVNSFSGNGTIIKNIEIRSDFQKGEMPPVNFRYDVPSGYKPFLDGELYVDENNAAQGTVIHDDGQGNCLVMEYALPGDKNYTNINIRGISSGATFTITSNKSPLRNYLKQYHNPIQDSHNDLWRENLNQFGIQIETAGVKLENVYVTNMGGNGINIVQDDAVLKDYTDALIENYWNGIRSNLNLYPNLNVFVNRSGLQFADSCRLVDCAAFNCGKNGLFIHGGIDAQTSNIIGFSSYGNNEWGFIDGGFLGNTYFGCIAHSNGNIFTKPTDNSTSGWNVYPWQDSSDSVYFGGSYAVTSIIGTDSDTPHKQPFNEARDLKGYSNSYGCYFSCYMEGDNLPDLSRANGITIYGGNLSVDFTRWDLLQKKNVRIGANSRVGGLSKLVFGEQNFTVDPSIQFQNNIRAMQVLIPQLDTRTAIGMSYFPALNNSQVFDKKAWESIKHDSAVNPVNVWTYDKTFDSQTHYWSFNRGVSTNDDLAEDVGVGIAQFHLDSDIKTATYDRAWIMQGSGYGNINNESANTVPFGWTDWQHPLSGGHFFFGNSIANQPSYFSFKILLTEDDLKESVNIISVTQKLAQSQQQELVFIYNYWLKLLPDNGNFNACFSLQYISPKYNPDLPISFEDQCSIKNGSSLFISEYNYVKAPDNNHDSILEVKIINQSSVIPNDVYLNVHIESFEMWPDLRFIQNKNWPWYISIDNSDNGFSPGLLPINFGQTITFINNDKISHYLEPINSTLKNFPPITLQPSDSFSYTFNTDNNADSSRQYIFKLDNKDSKLGTIKFNN